MAGSFKPPRCTGATHPYPPLPHSPPAPPHTTARRQEGYQADLLLVDGDPLQDIGVLADPQRRLKLIVKGGRVVKDAL